MWTDTAQLSPASRSKQRSGKYRGRAAARADPSADEAATTYSTDTNERAPSSTVWQIPSRRSACRDDGRCELPYRRG